MMDRYELRQDAIQPESKAESKAGDNRGFSFSKMGAGQATQPQQTARKVLGTPGEGTVTLFFEDNQKAKISFKNLPHVIAAEAEAYSTIYGSSDELRKPEKVYCCFEGKTYPAAVLPRFDGDTLGHFTKGQNTPGFLSGLYANVVTHYHDIYSKYTILTSDFSVNNVVVALDQEDPLIYSIDYESYLLDGVHCGATQYLHTHALEEEEGKSELTALFREASDTNPTTAVALLFFTALSSVYNKSSTVKLEQLSAHNYRQIFKSNFPIHILFQYYKNEFAQHALQQPTGLQPQEIESSAEDGLIMAYFQVSLMKLKERLELVLEKHPEQEKVSDILNSFQAGTAILKVSEQPKTVISNLLKAYRGVSAHKRHRNLCVFRAGGSLCLSNRSIAVKVLLWATLIALIFLAIEKAKTRTEKRLETLEKQCDNPSAIMALSA